MTRSRRTSSTAARPRRIYVPVLHGIGATDHESFAAKSVERIATHLDTGDTAWKIASCPAPCTEFAPKHSHVEHSSGAQAIIDPVSWFHLVDAPRRRDCARWLLRTLLTLCCVHFLVNGNAILNVFSGLPGARTSFRHPLRSLGEVTEGIWRVLRGMLWILVVSAAAMAITVVGVPLVFVAPRARRMVADALGWTSDEKTREAVIHGVSASMSRPRSDHIMIVGHSQGGAIAASVAERHSKKRTSLITLGSGLVVLSAIRAARSVPLGALITLGVTIPLYIVIAALAMWQLLVTALSLALIILLGTAHWGIGLWSVALAPGLSAQHAGASIGLIDQSAALMQAASPDLTWLLPLALLAPMIVFVYVRHFKAVADRIIEECRLDLPGVDLCATFDPVSFPLAALASPERVRRVSQSNSVVDHCLYFSNRVESLRAIDYQLTQLVTRKPGGSRNSGKSGEPQRRAEDDSLLAAEARASVRTARVARASAAFLTVVVAGVIWPSVPAIAWISGVVVYATATVAKQSIWKRRQPQTDWQTIRRFHHRPQHTWWHAATVFVAATTMLGAMMLPTSLGASALAGVTYLALIVATLCAIGRAAWTTWVSAIGLASCAAVWATQGTTYGLVIAFVFLGLVVLCLVTQFRRIRRGRGWMPVAAAAAG